MSETEYLEALKLGKKEQKKCLAEGRFPYLPVLDEILEHHEIQTEQKLGLQQIPLEYVVGTSTRGRTYAFAANFMPIIENGSEFSMKWENLAAAQVDEGIRDPIIVYEFLNRYYVVEGNKRVSVLKYYGADSISAIVRKVPKYSEDEDIKLYYELMKFQEETGLKTIEFSHLGEAEALIECMGAPVPWEKDTQELFRGIMFYFEKAYKQQGGDNLSITLGDAIVTFMRVYGLDAMLAMRHPEYVVNITKCWSEFLVKTEKNRVDLVLDPTEVHEKKSLLNYLIPVFNHKKFTVAFLYPKSVKESDWIYSHDLGRSYLEETFPDRIRTICVENVAEENIEEVLNSVIANGADIIFEVGPQMMSHSLKVAVEHPEVKILNCSLNEPHKHVRTYYARMYEAKFISGMIAGAMAENDKIAYVADYPIYGMIANINAFALGVACVNPRAKVYVDWSTRKDYDLDKFLSMNDIQYVSNQDMITPISASREFGLYRYEDGEATNLLLPLWNWGIFYEKLIQSILAGAYQSEGVHETKALNYWWGMSAGVIDLIYSKKVPRTVRRLAEHIAYDITVGDVEPFYGEIYSQDGTLRNQAEMGMSPEDIMKMDWLVENVVGEIPSIDLLQEQAKAVVELKGVEENKES